MNQHFKIFGDRVMLREVEEEKEIGGIYVPESATRAYLTMEVVEVGDGRLRGLDTPIMRRMCVKPGDRVMVQINPMMFSNNAQKINNEKFLVLNHHDIIARLEAGIFQLTVESFHPVGRWVLVRVEAPDKVGEIYLPNQAQPLRSAGEVKTFLAKVGEVAEDELGLPLGTRVMLEHARVSPLTLNRVAYAYVDCAAVAGGIPGDLDVPPVPAAAGSAVSA